MRALFNGIGDIYRTEIRKITTVTFPCVVAFHRRGENTIWDGRAKRVARMLFLYLASRN